MPGPHGFELAVRRNLLIGALLAALVVAALVDAVRGGDGESEAASSATATRTDGGDELSGPDVPPPGALPGALVLTAPEGCRLREIDLAASAFGKPGPETLCRVWVSPAGEWAVVESGPGEGAGSRKIALVRLGDPPEIERTLGVALGDVAWSADGARIAWCQPDGTSAVQDLDGEADQTLPGCDPHFGPDGSLLTVPNRSLRNEIWRNGSVELDAADFAQGFEPGTTGPVEVLEFDVASDGLLAVSVSRLLSTGAQTVLELWRGGTLEGSAQLPDGAGPDTSRLGGLLRFGPTGNELAIGYSGGRGGLTIVDLGLQNIVLRSAPQRAFAWSPDGDWLALAVAGEIRVFGSLRDVPVYVIPADAAALGWTVGEEPPAGR